MKNLLCVVIMLLVASTASAVVPIVIDDDGDQDGFAGPNATEVNMSTHNNGGWTAPANAFNATVAFNGENKDNDPPGGASDGNITYTFDASLGLVANETYDVYVYWPDNGQGNLGVAHYLVSDGLGDVAVSQAPAPAADLLVADPVSGSDFGFQFLGTVTDDGDAVITVNLSSGGTTEFFLADAMVLALPILASNFDPCDGETGVPVTANLGWVLDASVTNCDVYFGSDPNFINNPKVVNAVHQESYDPTGDMDNDTTYYWRVDTRVGTTVHEGVILDFTTIPAEPIIDEDPCGLTVDAGETAVFRVKATNATGYSWQMLDAAGNVSTVGTNSSTLTITNVQKANEGTYWCELTNTAATIETARVNLMTRRLVALYEFEDSLGAKDDEDVACWPGDYVDPNTENPDPDPVFASGIEGQSLQLAADELHVQITDSADFFNFYPQGYTVNLWVKTEQTNEWGVMATKRTRDGYFGWGLTCDDNNEMESSLWQVETVTGTSDIADNEWHMVTGTYDAETGTCSVYVDGLVEDQSVDAGKAPINDQLVVFGADDILGAFPYAGLLDKTSIYSYALDPVEIAVLYTDVTGDTLCVGGNPEYDLNDDCRVDILDFAELSADWLECNIVPTCLP